MVVPQHGISEDGAWQCDSPSCDASKVSYIAFRDARHHAAWLIYRK